MRNFFAGVTTATLVFAGLAIAGLALIFFVMPDPPNIYRTSIYDITLPKGWTCVQEGSELVCRPEGEQARHAVLIAALKYRNPKTDTLDAYTEHVAKPITAVPADGKTMTSTVESVQRTVIDGRIWVDATHLNSEVRGYRTRYLGTTTVQAAILITFSCYKDDFGIYQPMFEGMVRSLNIYQRQDGAAAS